jgi:hypothetical protein
MIAPTDITKDYAIYPFMVETKPTKSWSSHSIWRTLEHAEAVRDFINAEHPRLPTRVKHYTLGPQS